MSQTVTLWFDTVKHVCKSSTNVTFASWIDSIMKAAYFTYDQLTDSDHRASAVTSQNI